MRDDFFWIVEFPSLAYFVVSFYIIKKQGSIISEFHKNCRLLLNFCDKQDAEIKRLQNILGERNDKILKS